MTEQESLERAIHEEVGLCPYDPAWPELFEAERVRLLASLPGLLLEVQHIGSTAIPGMAAKPIIDIMIGVASMAVADLLMVPLIGAGYTTSAEFNATLVDRRWFMRHAEGRRTHHLHVMPLGGDEWRRRLRFREVLRASPALAGQYLQLKQQLASRYAGDREQYTDAKTDFVSSIADDIDSGPGVSCGPPRNKT